MIRTALAVVIACIAVALPEGQSQNDVEDILRQAEARREQYVDTFKDLTTVETRLTEIFDKDGRLAKQQTVVSDFLVYRSPLGNDAVEFRVAREVDGRAVGNPTEDGAQPVSTAGERANARAAIRPASGCVFEARPQVLQLGWDAPAHSAAAPGQAR